MLSFIFYTFLAYLLYQIVFRFLLPIYRTTRQVKKGFREMHRRMNEQGGQAAPRPEGRRPGTNPKNVGDYIDFEEVK